MAKYTSKEQEKIRKGHCPKCDGVNVHGTSPQVDGHVAWVDVECKDCNHEWEEIYNYSHAIPK